MAEYAGAAEKRRVYEEFAWGNKVPVLYDY